MEKGEIPQRVFVVMVLLIFAFLIADLALSYVSICHSVGKVSQCKLVPAIQLLPTF